MTRSDAERVFGKITNHASHDEVQLRRNLRGLLIDHRVMVDAGLDVAMLSDPARVSRMKREASDRIAYRQKAGRAPLNEVLPVCDRWGDMHANAYAFHSLRSKTCDVLGYESRPTLPTATIAAADGHRVGPGGTMRADMESSWDPVQTLASILAEKEHPTGDAPSECEEADPGAVVQDGFRVWPPRALATEEAAGRVAALVSQTCDTIQGVDPKLRTANGAGVYSKAWAVTLGENILSDVAKRNTLGMGVVLFTREPIALHAARKYSLHGAMAAYARGCPELGKQLERLGDLVLTLKR